MPELSKEQLEVVARVFKKLEEAQKWEKAATGCEIAATLSQSFNNITDAALWLNETHKYIEKKDFPDWARRTESRFVILGEVAKLCQKLCSWNADRKMPSEGEIALAKGLIDPSIDLDKLNATINDIKADNASAIAAAALTRAEKAKKSAEGFWEKTVLVTDKGSANTAKGEAERYCGEAAEAKKGTDAAVTDAKDPKKAKNERSEALKTAQKKASDTNRYALNAEAEAQKAENAMNAADYRDKAATLFKAIETAYIAIGGAYADDQRKTEANKKAIEAGKKSKEATTAPTENAANLYGEAHATAVKTINRLNVAISKDNKDLTGTKTILRQAINDNTKK